MFLIKLAKVATFLTGLTILGSLEIANAQTSPPWTRVNFPVYYSQYPNEPHQARNDATVSCENTKNQVDTNLYETRGCLGDPYEAEFPSSVYFEYRQKY
jgi:hypothetical protein